jgi:phage-related protein
MATFPSITARYGISKQSKPNIRTVQFGDGYEQRLTYGLNQNLKIWKPEFSNISETDADTIETFLDARAADNASFDWTPPGESSASKFICLSWTKTIPYKDRATIKASFQEVAEP